MKVGAFSISLSVKDIEKSRDFYSNLGFSEMGGDIDQNWLIMRNGESVIGLFQGMFPKNMMTFNPGWDQFAQDLQEFDDIRDIQRHLKREGITVDDEADEEGSGPDSFTVTDPDGNIILFDQHR